MQMLAVRMLIVLASRWSGRHRPAGGIQNLRVKFVEILTDADGNPEHLES
jgi:hypothetical protein